MRICLVGHFAAAADNRGDLGTKQVGFQIATRISERHETIQMDIKDALSWRQMRGFKPQVIHFILSPSTSGLLAARLCALFGTGAKTVLSAPNPNLASWRMGALLRPDLVLVQSYESESMFRRMGCDTRFLPNGVDVQRFVPASAARKRQLRKKYGIARDRLVILHVGPLIRRRHVELLAGLQNVERQVMIVGRMPVDQQVHKALLEAGCIVLTEYVEHIEELYALADCYVFPTPPAHRGASIEMPLSVLEAMSCNLPVFTTRFGALPRAFDEGEGLVFVDSDDDLAGELHRVVNGLEPRTRDKVLLYSWDSVVDSLGGIYEEISRGTGR
jgi:glycosyltransferase involved in cell wall biosynthesis